MAQAVSGNGSAKLHLLSAWWLLPVFAVAVALAVYHESGLRNLRKTE